MKRAIFSTLSVLFLSGALLANRARPEHNMRREQPKYMRVPGFKDCLEHESMGSWTRLCLPMTKPEACHSTSWDQLVRLYHQGEIPACRQED